MDAESDPDADLSLATSLHMTLLSLKSHQLAAVGIIDNTSLPLPFFGAI